MQRLPSTLRRFKGLLGTVATGSLPGSAPCALRLRNPSRCPTSTYSSQASVSTNTTNIVKSPFPDLVIPRCSVAELILNISNDDAHTYGDTVAFRMEGKGQMSYNELKRTAKAVGASVHHTLQMQQGSMAAILLPNCLEFAPILHGLMAVGVTASPMNPGYTPKEIAYQLNDSHARTLFVHASFLEKALEASKLLVDNHPLNTIVVVDSDSSTNLSAEGISIHRYEDLASAENILFPRIDVDPKHDIALLPYSSGTTGRPKGVVLTHENLVANVTQVVDGEGALMKHGEGTRQLALLPMFHIYGFLMCINVGLSKGWTMTVLNGFVPDSFLGTIQDHKIQIIHLVPPIFIFLAKHPKVDEYDLSSLENLFSGAAPLMKDVTMQVQGRLPSMKPVRQLYGMTELSPVALGDLEDPTIGSCGVLIPNCEMKFLCVHTQAEVAPGEEGEVCVRGPNVMKEYYKRPEETDASFTDDGFLRTGDVGYMDKNGRVFIVDRMKELIKVKGFQVAPTELEDLLLSHASVDDSAVIARPDEFAGELPKAYVVLKKGHSITEEDMREWVNSSVSSHKKLVEVEFIAQIPKNPSGKILRRVLRDMEKEKLNL